jgi:predicted nucleic acid-binding protein
LLDSDTVIQFLKGDTQATQLVGELYRQGDVLCTCAVVMTEVYSGLRPYDVPRSDTFLLSMRFLPAVHEIGRQAGLWRFEFARQGLRLSAPDCLIAATAHHYGATLITGNTNHFPMTGVATLGLPWG